MSPTPDSSAPAAIILAAGKGTRMNSDLPKVCHPIGGRAMVCAVVDACFEAGCEKVVVVVGYKQELVREALAGYAGRVEYAVQDEQLGTGHAVACARGAFDGLGDDEARDVFVLCGDGPLIRASTLETLLDRHRSTGAAATLATSVIADPSGYGRVKRDEGGRFMKIVEQKNADADELRIREVNPSYYCFARAMMFETLAGLTRNELSGEYYVTDAPEMMLGAGYRVEVIEAVPPEDVLSINTPEQLAEVDWVFRSRAVAGGSEVTR